MVDHDEQIPVRLPEGFEAISLTKMLQSADEGSFGQVVCRDGKGDTFFHFQSEPRIPDSLVMRSGKTDVALKEEFQRNFQGAIEKSMADYSQTQGGGITATLHQSDGRGGFTYRLRAADGSPVHFGKRTLLSASNAGIPLADDVGEFAHIFHANHDHLLAFQANHAINGMMNNIVNSDFKSALELPAAVSGFGQYGAEKFLKHLNENPETLAVVEKELGKGGLKDFRYLGAGRSGICLEAVTSTGKPVALMIRGGGHAFSMRHPIPHQLQPLHSFAAGGINIEVMPKLDNYVPTEDGYLLREAIAYHRDTHGGRYAIEDPAVGRNSGKSYAGTTYYFDGDGIVQTRSAVSDSGVSHGQDTHWVNPDGQWKQYTEYQAEHEMFNSPLHQAGGKIVPPKPVVAAAPVVEPVVRAAPEVTAKPVEPTVQAEIPVTPPPKPVEPAVPAAAHTEPQVPHEPAAPQHASQPHAPATPPPAEHPPVAPAVGKGEAAAAEAIKKDAKFFTGKRLAIAGGIVALGALVYAGKKYFDSQEKEPRNWVDRTQRQSPSAHVR